jgi:hypothetical protein
MLMIKIGEWMMKIIRLILLLVMIFPIFSNLLLADDKADWVHVGSLAGKLLGPPRDGKIRISLAHQFGEIDRDMALRAEAMRKKLLEIRQKGMGLPKNSPAREEVVQELENGLADLQVLRSKIILVHQTGDVLELVLRSPCNVRSNFPPGGFFDEKGNIRKFTKKSVAEMRGPLKLPGFASSLKKCEESTSVLVYVYKKKPLPKGPNPKPDLEQFDLFAGLIIILDAE